MEILLYVEKILQLGGSGAAIVILALLWRFDRRVLRLEIIIARFLKANGHSEDGSR